MRIDQLLVMADYLDEVVAKRPRYKFRMRQFQDQGFDASECHTAACAIGHAIFDKVVPFSVSRKHPEHIQWKGLDQDMAVCEYYGITSNEFLELFGPNLKNDPHCIAGSIRNFIARKVEAGED